MEKYVRVSQILAMLQDFSHIDPVILTAKQDLGTRVHEGIEQYVKGMLPLLTLKETPYLTSFLKWRGTINPKFKILEKRFYCDDKMLTGKIDALAFLGDSIQMVLLDWKTSVAESPKIWPLQAHFYHYLLSKDHKLVPLADHALFIKLDSKGEMPKVYNYKIDPNTTTYCLSLVDEYWKKVETSKNNS